jgi:iron complex transport system permease protein
MTNHSGGEGLLERYAAYNRRKQIYMIISFLFLAGLFVLGISLGPSKLGLSAMLASIQAAGDATDRHILLQLRLPRLLAAILSGTALAVSGVVMQSVLRNPLGSPFTLGISNAAAFGAALAFVFFDAEKAAAWPGGAGQWLQPMLVTLSAFVWAIVCCLFILLIANLRGATPDNMILTGIIASTLFTALTSILQYIADDVKLASIVFWTFGDLSKGDWRSLLLQLLLVVPVLAYFMNRRQHFNALDAGDEVAHSLGVRVNRFRLTAMVLSSLLTASIVAFYGIIAFVGLVVPHIVRKLIGGDERFLLPAAAVSGAVFLLLCDIVARSLLSPVVIPVGILTSLIGAPLFILLLIRRKQYW